MLGKLRWIFLIYQKTLKVELGKRGFPCATKQRHQSSILRSAEVVVLIVFLLCGGGVNVCASGHRIMRQSRAKDDAPLRPPSLAHDVCRGYFDLKKPRLSAGKSAVLCNLCGGEYLRQWLIIHGRIEGNIFSPLAV
jgi:hypothetical protein